jgi:hypothetical protein
MYLIYNNLLRHFGSSKGNQGGLMVVGVLTNIFQSHIQEILEGTEPVEGLLSLIIVEEGEDQPIDFQFRK